MSEIQTLQAQADRLLAQIEADVRAAGIDPNTTEYTHTDSAEWMALNDRINALR